jgi:hypothetical protein
VEKIVGRKILFSSLLLMATALIVAIILLTFFSMAEAGQIPPKYIFGLAVSSISLVIVAVAFIWNFMIIKSINIKHISNNKNPQILGGEADIHELEGESEEEKDPYFGVETERKDAEADKSLMLESKRDSGEVPSSVVSKTLTDYVMKRMYKHDEPSQKGRS